MNGLFITIEGPDGAGKTSVAKKLVPRLAELTQKEIVATREPGGSKIAESIRNILLDVNNIEMDVRTEAILLAAARRQHLVERILPNLAQGRIVLCDRFVDSSLVYQGVGRGIGIEAVRELNDFAIEGTLPDTTIYLDISAEAGIERIHRNRDVRQFDRLDQEDLSFHRIVREAYLDIVSKNSKRFVVVDASQTLEDVVQSCLDVLCQRYPDVFVVQQ